MGMRDINWDGAYNLREVQGSLGRLPRRHQVQPKAAGR